jgi:hypothetical protein
MRNRVTIIIHHIGWCISHQTPHATIADLSHVDFLCPSLAHTRNNSLLLQKKKECQPFESGIWVSHYSVNIMKSFQHSTIYAPSFSVPRIFPCSFFLYLIPSPLLHILLHGRQHIPLQPLLHIRRRRQPTQAHRDIHFRIFVQQRQVVEMLIEETMVVEWFNCMVR